MSLSHIFSIFWKFAGTVFSRLITKKAKIVKFTKICQTGKVLTKDGQRGTALKLVVPPYLLKQEKVCLILTNSGSLHVPGTMS